MRSQRTGRLGAVSTLLRRSPRMAVRMLVVGLLLLVLASANGAQVNLLTNGSFEQGPSMSGANASLSSGDLPGWNYTPGYCWYMRNGAYGVAQAGLRFINCSAGQTLSQSFPVEAGQRYTVSYYEALRADGTGKPDAVAASISLAAGSASGTTNQIATNPLVNSSVGDWQPYSFSFTPDSTTTATLTFEGIRGEGYYPALDNVSVTRSVAAASATVVADSTNEFSNAQGSNHWYYGYYQGDVLGGTFEQLAYYIPSGTPIGGAWWANDSNPNDWNRVAPIVWNFGQHPGEPSAGMPKYSVRRWVSPFSGKFVISGEWGDQDGSGGDGAICSIRVNGAALASYNYGDGGSVMGYTVTTTLTAGDAVDFVVDPKGGYAGDSTKFIAVITRPTPIDLSLWVYSAKITFGGYDRGEALTNFPALVILNTGLNNFAYDQFSSPCGDDLRFVDAQTNELNYEVESWDTNGNSYVWVQVPVLTNNTEIRACWGNTNAVGVPAYTLDGSAWTNGYAGVWHLSEAGTAFSDATAINPAGVRIAAGAVSGQIGGGQQFVKADHNSIDTGTCFPGLAQPFSTEIWVKPPAGATTYNDLFGNHQIHDGASGWVLESSGTTNAYYFAYNEGNGSWMVSDALQLAADVWQQVTVNCTASEVVMYLDGVEKVRYPITVGLMGPNSMDTVKIGASAVSTNADVEGLLDEFRVSSVARSSNWVWAAWFNMASNSAFMTVSPVESSDIAPRIRTDPATGIGTTSATLNGYLSSTGTAATTVFVYWGTTDEGTNNTWAHSAQFPGVAAVGTLSTNVTLSPSGVTYYYRYCATNANAVVWAASSARFLAGEVTLVATAPVASEVGPTSGTFTVTRPAAATNGALTVNYTLGGTASNGVDYVSLSGAVTILDGESNATITVTPILDDLVEGAETVRVSLASGPYGVGSPSQAEVTIADVPPEDLAQWAKKTSFTFSGYARAEPLSNFPVLVVLSTNLSGFSYADFLSGARGDLRFADATETNPLNYEVEDWDTNGNSHVWVQVPTLTNNAAIWAFWGKAGAVTPVCTTNGATWANGYIGVWHMNQLDALDSTSNHLNGAASGGVTLTGAGPVGTAATFDGSSGLITIANRAILNPTQITVEAWADIGAIGDWNMMVTKGFDSVCIPYDLILQPNSQAKAVGFGGWSQAPTWGLYMAYSADQVSVGDRRHLSGTFDGNAFKIYMNGSLSGQQAYGYPLPSNNTPLSFGGAAYWDVYPTAPYQFNGTLDEIRISDGPRSADWVWATWFNMASNSDFVTVAPVVLASLPGIRNEPATDVSTTNATLNGYLSRTGLSATAVFVYWGTTDEGTNDTWAHSAEFPGAAGVGAFSTNVALSPSDVTYYYRYCATNSSGIAWAASSAHFMAAGVTVQATDAAASEAGPDTGTFTLYRPATATQESVVVNYTIDGTASNGVDYTPLLTGTVTIPAGESNKTMTITPVADGNSTEGDETVQISLASGLYAIGSPSVAGITIADNASIPPSNTWLGGTGYWTNGADWSCGFAPLDAQAVDIPGGSVTLDRPTAALRSFTLSNATLTFANFSGVVTNLLTATDVFIGNGAILTHATNTDVDGGNGWQVDGAVAIDCANLTLAAGGQINVDAKGYAGGVGAAGKGPGAGGHVNQYGGGGGGGYGGVGGVGSPADTGYSAPGGLTNGTASGVEYPGSGGGGGPGQAGNGGGLVRIVATGDVTVDGAISANGVGYVVHGMAGAGSGGGVYIQCRRFLGAGTVCAQAGVPSIYWAGAYGGAGGGGRIAVHYDTTAQQSVGTQPTVLFALGGNFGKSEGRPGTLYLSDTQFFPTTDLRLESGAIVIPGFTAWAPSHLTISNGLAVFPSGCHLTVSNDLVTAGFKGGLELSGGRLDVLGNMDLHGENYVGADPAYDGAKSVFTATPVSVGGGLTLSGPGNAALIVSYSNLAIGGAAVLTNSAFLRLYSSPNSSTSVCGQVFSVGGRLTVAAGAYVIPYSDPTSGGSVKFALNGLTVAAGGEINADGNGYAGGNRTAGQGTGGGGHVGVGAPGGGGGYGGHGGMDASGAWGSVGGVGGIRYGTSNALPFYPGSGGAGGPGVGGNGGGLVWIDASAGNVTLDGLISANGAVASAHGMAGHGSGGGIYISCKRFAGNGSLMANGAGAGGWVGGVGGGGRIAVWRRYHNFTGTASVTNGVNTAVGGTVYGMDGVEVGTIFWGDTRPTGTTYSFR